jgi:uncharacterized YccA/Bax inhibitor family protein
MKMWDFLAGRHESQVVRRPGPIEVIFWAFVGVCAAIAFIVVYPR